MPITVTNRLVFAPFSSASAKLVWKDTTRCRSVLSCHFPPVSRSFHRSSVASVNWASRPFWVDLISTSWLILPVPRLTVGQTNIRRPSLKCRQPWTYDGQTDR